MKKTSALLLILCTLALIAAPSLASAHHMYDNYYENNRMSFVPNYYNKEVYYNSLPYYNYYSKYPQARVSQSTLIYGRKYYDLGPNYGVYTKDYFYRTNNNYIRNAENIDYYPIRFGYRSYSGQF